MKKLSPKKRRSGTKKMCRALLADPDFQFAIRAHAILGICYAGQKQERLAQYGPLHALMDAAERRVARKLAVPLNKKK